MLSAAAAGEQAARPFAAVAPAGPLGEVFAGAAASIAHDWDDYLYMGHTGHSAVWTARAFAPDDAERRFAAQVAGNEVAGRLGAALAYYTIPLTLVYFVRRRSDLASHWIFLGFALFIVACGTTHVMEVLSIWRPMYWLEWPRSRTYA